MRKQNSFLSELFVEKKDLPSAKIFLLQIKRICYTQILEKHLAEKHKPKNERKLIAFVCDGCQTYKTAFDLLFRRVAKLTFGIPIKYKKSGVKHNNNAIERYNKEIKRRAYGFRDLEYFKLKILQTCGINSHQNL